MRDFFTDKNGRPVYVTGLQAHNSSTGTPLIEKTMDAIRLYGGNTIEAPVYWYAIEKEKDCFDMSQVRTLIDQARSRSLHLIILWFGVNKNGHPNYAPEWFKRHPEIYWIALGPDHAPVPSVSVHCEATLERDRIAFTKLVEFVRDYDRGEKTVLAIQIENEFGYGGTDRDYGEAAEQDFLKPVPEAIRGLKFEDAKASGRDDSWIGVFGRRANEAFSAWHHARFVEALAEAGKAVYDLPFYCNIALGELGMDYPGMNYNAGAGVPRMIDLWKIAAPHLDLLCPDIYLGDRRTYERISDKYDRPDNALFIPETSPRGEQFAMDIILAAGEHHAIGVCAFGAETALDEDGSLLPEARPVAYSMRAIAGLSPLLIKYYDSERVHAFVQDEFTSENTLVLSDYVITARYIRDNPGFLLRLSNKNVRTEPYEHYLTERGRGLLIQAGPDEFYLAGSGIGLEIRRLPDPEDRNPYAHAASRMAGQLNFLSVEEGHFEDGEWVIDYIRNGDESNFQLYAFAGQVVRIRLNPDDGMRCLPA